MPRIVLTNAYVVFGTTDISQYVTSVSLSSTLDVVETTGMSNTSRTRVAGLRDNQITLEFNQDYGTGALEQLIYPSDVATKIGTTVGMLVRPTSSNPSTTNPSYVFDALISEWQSLSGSVGELATVSVTWPISGAITKTTA